MGSLECSRRLHNSGRPAPRTCSICQLGPCIYRLKINVDDESAPTEEEAMTNDQRYWDPERLRKAAELLNRAADFIRVSFPHSNARPDPDFLPSAESLIRAAEECIQKARPSDGR